MSLPACSVAGQAPEASTGQWLWRSLSKLPRYAAAALLPRQEDDVLLPLTHQEAARWSSGGGPAGADRVSREQQDVLKDLGVVQCSGGGFVSWH